MLKSISKIFALVGLIFLISSQAHSQLGTLPFSGASVANASFTAQWAPLKIGAGGQITAVYNYPDGTILARSDNYGAWLYVPSGSCAYGWVSYTAPCWKQLITATSIPGWNINLSDNNGATELVAAPGNTSVLYMIYEGGLFVSTNKGTTWVKCTNFVGSTLGANSGAATGPMIAVDPNNPDVVYVDTESSGIYVSSNGRSGATATFTQVATVGTTTRHVVAFQPGSSTHILIYTKGTAGAFESTNGSTFSAIVGGPPNTLNSPHIVADQFNQFWVWDSGGGTGLYRWASSAWTSISTTASGNGGVAAFAVDPNSASVGANHIATANYAGQLNISSNNGTAWTGNSTNETISVGAAQPAWLANANQNQGTGSYLLNGYSIAFDSSSNVFFGGGLGLWQANAPITASATVWNANTLGIEQLVGITTISPPGGWPIMGVWDKGFFTLKNPDVFPSVQWDNDTSKNAIIGGWGLDWTSADSTFITGWATSNISADIAPASSTDGGNTWTQWGGTPTHTGNQGGGVAALDSTHWIVAPLGNQLQFTSNGGTTWTNSTITGSPTDWVGNSGIGLPLAADRVAANTYCAIRSGGTSFYFSTNAGSSFAASGLTNGGGAGQVDGNPGAFSFKSVPGQSGNFFYTAGEQGGSHPANTHLWKITKTTNPCDTATSVSANLKEVMSFGFGAPPPTGGTGYPTIYANGWLSGTQGYFQSVDGGATWTAINVPGSQIPWALNQADFPPDLTGDMDVYGRIYQTFAQSGGAYIDTADACPWVKFSNTNPHASLTGTVTLSAQHSGLVPVTAVDFYVDGSLIGRQTTGTGTPTTYSQSWVTGGVSTGAHTLKVLAEGSTNAACTTSLATGNSQSIPITTH